MTPIVESKRKNSTKIRFARLFLQSIMKMKIQKNSVNNSDHNEIKRRCRRIKTAAYSSMARAVGSKRTWSRAFIFKMRKLAICEKESVKRKRKKKRCKNKLLKIDRLRMLVPGGEALDVCGLLEETAHYIKSLSIQVKVMQTIADNSST